ncbi:RNA-directed DNA polymerase, eukaryota, reverse transcriptase zinc-binding domain protein [Tanacetum coccineum]
MLLALKNLEVKIDSNSATDEDRESRIKFLHEIDKIDRCDSLDLFQKSRINWDIKGDENSKFFHGIVNQRRRTNSIHGIMCDGTWVSDLLIVKDTFLNFFKEKFELHDSSSALPSTSFPSKLTVDDHSLLEKDVTLDEIKSAVWNCEDALLEFSGIATELATDVRKSQNPDSRSDTSSVTHVDGYRKVLGVWKGTPENLFFNGNDRMICDYQCNLGPDGRRRDADERLELCRGTAEFIVTTKFMVCDPMSAVFFFLRTLYKLVLHPAVLSTKLSRIFPFVDTVGVKATAFVMENEVVDDQPTDEDRLSPKQFRDRSNSTFITLIPKVSNPIHVKDYRPISLINTHYKIIAKILANRLAKVIDKIISQEQSAFILDRQILDGPLMLSEMIDWYKKRKKKMLIFKVDFEKAFDSVSWKYLDFVLHKLGFGLTWRAWIKACLYSSRTYILVNRSPTSKFSLKRGLRQGGIPVISFIILHRYGGSSHVFSVRVGCGFFCSVKKDITVTVLILLHLHSNRLFRLEKVKDCYIQDRLKDNQWEWNWSRSFLGVRNTAYLHDMINDISHIELNLDRDVCYWVLSNDDIVRY